jgi:mannitol/fructose-specific phosphotransferase system IIA component (Ntr-type)
MKILDYLQEHWVIPDLKGTDKRSVLKELSEVLVEPCHAGSSDELLQVSSKEKTGSTGIGDGITIFMAD